MRSLFLLLALISSVAMANPEFNCVHTTQHKFLRVVCKTADELELTDLDNNIDVALKSEVQSQNSSVKYDIVGSEASVWIPNSLVSSPSKKGFIRVGTAGENLYHCLRVLQ